MLSVIGRRPIRPAIAYLWFQGSGSFLHTLAFTLLLVYQVQTARLSPIELVLVGTVMEATCFLAEVPTGVVADLYSRRLSVLIGAVVIGFGLLIQGVFPSFVPILLGNVVWGVGYTFISGAAEAWITDEVGQDAVQPVFTRYEQLSLALTVLGTVAAGLIGMLDLRLPMITAGAAFLLLALIMTPLMPETGFVPVPRNRRESYRHMRRLLAEGLSAARHRGVVRSFLIIAVLTGISSEVFDRLWTAHVLAAFSMPDLYGVTDPALWFTAFALAGSLVALVANLVANRVAARRINAVHPAGLMAGLVLVQVAGIVGFALSPALWPALIAIWVRTAGQSIAGPIQAAWLARNVASSSRATTISLTSQADAIGQVVGGPPLGAVATRTSIPVALIISAILVTPAAVVYARLRPNRSERSQTLHGVR
jgi:DHA3 family tetracycline resistance protein-like MFS transporter